MYMQKQKETFCIYKNESVYSHNETTNIGQMSEQFKIQINRIKNKLVKQSWKITHLFLHILFWLQLLLILIYQPVINPFMRII